MIGSSFVLHGVTYYTHTVNSVDICDMLLNITEVERKRNPLNVVLL